jgi:tripartite ATP-independent transporter DctM subunit
MAIGMPIAFVLAATGLAHLFCIDVPRYFTILPQRLFAGINQFSLMAIPFFILTGEIMNKGGITRRLVNFARECVGFLQGGLAYTTVFVAVMLSAILGSANAVAAILGAVIVPEMIKDGYKDGFSAALIASSSVIGPIIPPSLTFILYGVLTGTSIGALFIAGIVPGILLGIGYSVYIWIYSRRNPLPRYKDKFSVSGMLRAAFKAIPALIVPLIIVGGILGGICTPTESGAVAVMAGLFIALFVYRSLSPREIPGMLLRTGMITAGIMMIVAFGNIFGWTMAIDKIPAALSAAITSFTSSPGLIIFLILSGMILVGMVMEGFAALIIFAPLLHPIGMRAGFDPVHFGVLISLVLCIGLTSPPVGMCLFVTSNVSGVPLSRINIAVLPFLLAAFIVLFALAYFPDLVMFLPNLYSAS